MIFPRPFNRTLLICGLVTGIVAVHSEAIYAQLRGHGGPVRALAVSADGKQLVSGSFDTAAIRWSLSRNFAEQVLRFHDAPVNAVAFLRDGRIATASEDAHIALWTPGRQTPDRVLEGHSGPIAALAVSPDGNWIASAAWDRTVRLWPLAGGSPRVLEGHTQNINGVAFSPDGMQVVSASYDGTIRIWQLGGDSGAVINVQSPLNTLAVASDGKMIAAGANGIVFFFSGEGQALGQIKASETPITQLALSRDGNIGAAASTRGSVAIFDPKNRKLLHTLAGPGLPIWSVAFMPDNKTLLTGGTDAMIRRWNAVTGEPVDSALISPPEDPLKQYAGDHGAEVFRACVACHTLKPDEAQKAGPTLWHIFGRRIATLPGYNFSPALKKLDIVWSKETVERLFEIGPAHYTPGTKMPEQTIGAEDDREALVNFLARVTGN
jgi:cytochrome c